MFEQTTPPVGPRPRFGPPPGRRPRNQRSWGAERCLGQLVLQGDDATRRVQSGAVVAQFPDPGGQAQLMTRVAPMSTGRALRVEQPHLIEAAQKPRGRTDDFPGPPHRVGRVVLVIELLVQAAPGWLHSTPIAEGLRCVTRTGAPGSDINTIYRRRADIGHSAPRVGLNALRRRVRTW